MAHADSGQRPLLVTTAMEESWGRDEPIVFLGEWCRRYSRRDAWQARSHTVLPYHWDDREKFTRDIETLRDLYERVLASLASALNNHHGFDHSLRYWRIILGPWLFHYIPTMFDRWECVATALDALSQPMTTTALAPPPRHPTPFDVSENTALAVKDAWNHIVFLEILARLGNGQVDVQRSDQVAEVALPKPAAPATGGTVQVVDRLLGRLFPSPRVTLVASYFPLSRLALLNLALGQVTRLFAGTFDFNRPQDGVTLEATPRLPLDLAASTPFEEYLLGRLDRDLPVAYLEAYPGLRRQALAIAEKPKAIMTASYHWGNEGFKIWCAEKTAAGVRLVTANHGGSVPPRDFSWSHDEEISDCKVVWSSPNHPKHRKLPPQFGSIAAPVRTKGGRRSDILWVATDFPRYAFRAQSVVIAGQAKTMGEFPVAFHNELVDSIRPAFRVRPFPTDLEGWWDQQTYLKDQLGPAVTDIREPIAEQMKRAKLLISGYPETFLNEAMASGLPTLLVYPRQWWQLDPQAEDVIDKLHEKRIAFWSPAEAARHVERIWENLDAWWFDAGVVEAREIFLRYARSPGVHYLRPWKKILSQAG